MIPAAPKNVFYIQAIQKIISLNLVTCVLCYTIQLNVFCDKSTIHIVVIVIVRTFCSTAFTTKKTPTCIVAFICCHSLSHELLLNHSNWSV